ncbi:hypothetical protein MAN_07788, partial [Metarhizium hybridum]
MKSLTILPVAMGLATLGLGARLAERNDRAVNPSYNSMNQLLSDMRFALTDIERVQYSVASAVEELGIILESAGCKLALNGNIMSRIQSLGENANKTLESTKEALQTREYLYGIVQGDAIHYFTPN